MLNLLNAVRYGGTQNLKSYRVVFGIKFKVNQFTIEICGGLHTPRWGQNGVLGVFIKKGGPKMNKMTSRYRKG